jgi:hypothetical protein
MNFDEEFEQAIAEMTLEELEATREALIQGQGRVEQLIREKTGADDLVADIDQCRRAGVVVEEAGTQPKLQIEYAGNIGPAQVWIKVGLSRNQAKLLKEVSRRLFKRKYQTSAQAALWTITQGLENIELLETRARQFKLQPGEGHKELALDGRARARLKQLN